MNRQFKRTAFMWK